MRKRKSDSSKCSAESEDSGLGLRVRMIQLPRGNNPGFNKKAEQVASISQSAWEHNNLLVFGQTTMTNTPAKSTEKGSETKSLLKKTLGKSKPKKYLTMTSLQQDFPVNLFPLLEGVRVFETSQEELFSSKSVLCLELKDHATYSLRMLKDYFLTKEAEPSQLYSFRWMNLGMMSNGRCSTLSIGYHKIGKGSLSSVLEERVDKKYYLSKTMLANLCEKNKVNGEISSALDANYHKGSSQGFGGLGRRLISMEMPQIANAVDPDGYLRATKRARKEGKPILVSLCQKRIRRLTPKECERLQGFPDFFTSKGTDSDGNKAKISDTQRYKMMGNALSVPVIEAIGKRLARGML